MGQGPFLDAPAGTGHDGHIGSGQAVRRQTLAPGPSFTGNIGKREFDGIDAAAEDADRKAQDELDQSTAAAIRAEQERAEVEFQIELLEFAGDYGRATLCVSQAAKYIGVGQ